MGVRTKIFVGVAALAVLGRESELGKKYFYKSIEIYKTNRNVKKYQHIFQKCGPDSFLRLVGVRVGLTTWANKLALRLSLESVC